jgi:hypothetical protein
MSRETFQYICSKVAPFKKKKDKKKEKDVIPIETSVNQTTKFIV